MLKRFWHWLTAIRDEPQIWLNRDPVFEMKMGTPISKDAVRRPMPDIAKVAADVAAVKKSLITFCKSQGLDVPADALGVAKKFDNFGDFTYQELHAEGMKNGGTIEWNEAGQCRLVDRGELFTITTKNSPYLLREKGANQTVDIKKGSKVIKPEDLPSIDMKVSSTSRYHELDREVDARWRTETLLEAALSCGSAVKITSAQPAQSDAMAVIAAVVQESRGGTSSPLPTP